MYIYYISCTFDFFYYNLYPNVGIPGGCSLHVLGQAASVTEDETVLPSKQHVQATEAQSIHMMIPKLEHNMEGMVPVNCVLLYKYKRSSRVRLPNVEGMVPFN